MQTERGDREGGRRRQGFHTFRDVTTVIPICLFSFLLFLLFRRSTERRLTSAQVSEKKEKRKKGTGSLLLSTYLFSLFFFPLSLCFAFRSKKTHHHNSIPSRSLLLPPLLSPPLLSPVLYAPPQEGRGKGGFPLSLPQLFSPHSSPFLSPVTFVGGEENEAEGGGAAVCGG